MDIWERRDTLHGQHSGETHLVLIEELLLQCLHCLTILIDVIILRHNKARQQLLMCHSGKQHKLLGCSGETHLVVQLVVQVCDECLILRLLLD